MDSISLISILVILWAVAILLILDATRYHLKNLRKEQGAAQQATAAALQNIAANLHYLAKTKRILAEETE